MLDSTSGFSKKAADFSKSPLGIIALFIVLVYSIAALVFGLSLPELVGSERLLLLSFIVFFPILVLLIFFILVTKFPNCLYPRSEFDSDEGFIRYQTPLERFSILEEKTIIARNNEEVKEELGDSPNDSKFGFAEIAGIGIAGIAGFSLAKNLSKKTSQPEDDFLNSDECVSKPKQKSLVDVFPIIDGPGQRMELARRIAYAENLAFEDLGKKYKTSIKKHVVLNCGPNNPRIAVDGYFEDDETEEFFFVEMRYFQGDFYETVIDDCIPKALAKSEADFFHTPFSIILYIIVDSIDNDLFVKSKNEIETYMKSFHNNMTVLINKVSDLEHKYN